MQIIENYNKAPISAQGSVIALGNFDGVHKGHVKVIQAAKEIATSNSRPCAVMTFEPHPINFFKPEIVNYRLTDKMHKASLLEKIGVDFLYTIDFNREFSKITASDFIEVILLEKLAASHIVTGFDYIFGHNKGGSTQMLEEYSKTHGFGYSCIEAIGDGEKYSSTRVRRALHKADLETANTILGRNYSLHGEIIHGDNRGKSIGFPTINIDMQNYLRPQHGVYAVNVDIEGYEKKFKGVANIGVKPTFNGSQEALEVHIFDFDNDVYGKMAKIEFLRYIRAERKFNNADELVYQIKQDCISAKM